MVDFVDMPLPDQVPCLRKNLTNRLLDSVKSKLEVSPDIFLYMYKNKLGEDFFIVYEIEVMRYCSGVHFILDFTGSHNISLLPFHVKNDAADTPSSFSSSFPGDENNEKLLQLTATVAPFQRQKFGQIHLLNPLQRAILKYKYSWNQCEVIHKTDMTHTAREQEKGIAQELHLAGRLLPPPPPSNSLVTALTPPALHRLFTHHNKHTHIPGGGAQTHERGKSTELSSFIDQAFPPTDASLCPKDANVSAIETNFPVVWNRPM